MLADEKIDKNAYIPYLLFSHKSVDLQRAMDFDKLLKL